MTRLIYNSSDPAGACRLLCKVQSCGWLSKGPGFLGSGSHQSQLEYDTEWPQWGALVMSMVWRTVRPPLLRLSLFNFVSLSLSLSVCTLEAYGIRPCFCWENGTVSMLRCQLNSRAVLQFWQLYRDRCLWLLIYHGETSILCTYRDVVGDIVHSI